MDAKGDPVTFNTSNFAVQGVRDTFRAEYAIFHGIPNTDVRILLIMGLIVPATIPVKDDLVFIRNQWHKVRRVLEIDPANATALLQCFETEAPA